MNIHKGPNNERYYHVTEEEFLIIMACLKKKTLSSSWIELAAVLSISPAVFANVKRTLLFDEKLFFSIEKITGKIFYPE